MVAWWLPVAVEMAAMVVCKNNVGPIKVLAGVFVGSGVLWRILGSLLSSTTIQMKRAGDRYEIRLVAFGGIWSHDDYARRPRVWVRLKLRWFGVWSELYI